MQLPSPPVLRRLHLGSITEQPEGSKSASEGAAALRPRPEHTSNQQDVNPDSASDQDVTPSDDGFTGEDDHAPWLLDEADDVLGAGPEPAKAQRSMGSMVGRVALPGRELSMLHSRMSVTIQPEREWLLASACERITAAC